MIKIKDILSNTRKETNTNQNQLCRGLCSEGAYSQYEQSGERIPNCLLFQMLLERMGKSAGKFVTILSTEEYDYLCWKRTVLSSFQQGKYEETARYLEDALAEEIVIDERIQRQFVKLMRASLLGKSKPSSGEAQTEAQEEALALLREAVNLTMPDITAANMEQYLIGKSEMYLLFEQIRALIRLQKEDEAYSFLIASLQYIERHYDDYEIKVKTYPKAVRLLVPLLRKRGMDTEGQLYCKRAIELLCWQGVLYDLEELMEAYLQFCQRWPDNEELIRMKKQLHALHEVRVRFGVKCSGGETTEEEWLSYQNEELYLVHEVIRGSRVSRRMSQDKLSEDICTPETMSRIETGKQTPKVKRFRALMEKTETDLDYYNSELETDDFHVLERKLELDRAISLHEWEKAEGLLTQIKSEVNLESERNRTLLYRDECCIRYNQGNCSAQEFLAACMELTGYEPEQNAGDVKEKRKREKAFWNQFFTKEKVDTMNAIACLYQQTGQIDRAIEIEERLLAQLMDSRVELSDRYRSSGLLMMNLSSWYGISGQFEQCLEMCDRGILLCFETGRIMMLPAFLMNRVETLNDIAGYPMKESRQWLRCAYYLAEIVADSRMLSYIDQYYQFKYEEVAEW